jgi:hypothetical protein
MKKLILLLFVSLFASALFAQEMFTVPVPTDLQKYRSAAWQWSAAYLLQINFAKSMGKSVEDVANFNGDQAKLSWNKEAGFEGFVKGILYNFVCITPQGTVEILEQNDHKVVFQVTKVYPQLKDQGPIFNVTYEEYLKFWSIAIARIGDYLGATYTQKEKDDGIVATIEKK